MERTTSSQYRRFPFRAVVVGKMRSVRHVQADEESLVRPWEDFLITIVDI